MTSFSLRLRTYIGSISTDEHRSMRHAIAEAAASNTVTYLDAPEGQAAIVPREAAEWWEAYAAELCPFCAAGQHASCMRYAGQSCSCVNVAVHNEFEMARSIRAGLLKRH